MHTSVLSAVMQYGQTDRQDTELRTSAAEGMLPLGPVTMLFLVLFV